MHAPDDLHREPSSIVLSKEVRALTFRRHRLLRGKRRWRGARSGTRRELARARHERLGEHTVDVAAGREGGLRDDAWGLVGSVRGV